MDYPQINLPGAGTVGIPGHSPSVLEQKLKENTLNIQQNIVEVVASNPSEEDPFENETANICLKPAIVRHQRNRRVQTATV